MAAAMNVSAGVPASMPELSVVERPAPLLTDEELRVEHYAESIDRALAGGEHGGDEIDLLAMLAEAVADDPDAEPPALYHALMAKYARDGATMRQLGPVEMTITAATIGARNAR